MQGNELIKQYTLEARSISQPRLTEAQTTQQSDMANRVDIPETLMVALPLAFVMGWGVVFFVLSKSWMVARHELTSNLKRFHKVPCSNCKFFSANPYLKCAVNPSIALTEKAADCSEYSPQEAKSIR